MNYEVTENDISIIEKTTRGQAANANWFKFKKGRISGSNIGDVMKMRTLTSNITVLKKICYPNSTNFSTAATRYCYSCEKDAIRAYCILKKKSYKFNGKHFETISSYVVYTGSTF